LPKRRLCFILYQFKSDIKNIVMRHPQTRLGGHSVITQKAIQAIPITVRRCARGAFLFYNVAMLNMDADALPGHCLREFHR
jgi:hypothetical protein